MANASTMKSIITTIDAILSSHDVDFSEVMTYKAKEQQEHIKKLKRDIDALNEVLDARNNADQAHYAANHKHHPDPSTDYVVKVPAIEVRTSGND